jgi:glycerophosphoryl diester phosphodiesterase
MKPLIYSCLSVLAAIMLSACDESDIIQPPVPPTDFIGQTRPLTSAQQELLDGVYAVTEGADLLGDSVVVTRSGSKVTIYTGVKGGHIILQMGELDSVIMFTGYWKYQQSNETGLAQGYMKREEGGAWVTSAGMIPAPTTRLFRLFLGAGSDLPSKKFSIRFARDFSENAKRDQKDFLIIGHRGGGRMSDGVPHSENTIELAMVAEELGANAIEVDVRKSADGVVYLYHDATINPRLVRKNTLVGATEDYTWNVLRSEITLTHGEKIPKLGDFLRAVVDRTKAVFVYLDTKTSGDGILKDMADTVKLVNEYAASVGRSELKIYLGIPNTELLDELKELRTKPGYENVESLIETSYDDAVNNGATVWSPRWSDGTQQSSVNAFTSVPGKVAVTWTINMPVYIQEYLAVPRANRFTGFLTDYPMIVKYYILMQL